MSFADFVQRFADNTYEIFQRDDKQLLKLLKDFNDFIENCPLSIETILANDKASFLIKKLGTLMAVCKPYNIASHAFRWNGFIKLYMSLVDWDVLSAKEDLRGPTVELFQKICLRHPLVKNTLEKNGISIAIVKLLKKEQAKNDFILFSSQTMKHCCYPYVSACLIYEFMRRFFFDEISVDACFIYPTIDSVKVHNKELLKEESYMYWYYMHEIFNMCLNPNYLSYTAYHYLNLKMTRCYTFLGWTLNDDDAEKYLKLLFSKISPSVYIGFALAKMLTMNTGTKVPRLSCQNLNGMVQGMMRSCASENQVSIERLKTTSLIVMRSLTNPFYPINHPMTLYHNILREFEMKNDDSALKYLVQFFTDQYLVFTDFHPEMLKILLVYLLPTDTNYNGNIINLCYKRLKHFMQTVLDVSDDHTEEFEIDSKGMEAFRSVVSYIMKFVEYLSIRDAENQTLFVKYYPDLFKQEHLMSTHTLDVDVGFCNWSILKVLFSSRLSDCLLSNPMYISLKLISIMYAVNENIDNLFFFAKRRPLLSSHCFYNNILIREANRLLAEKTFTAPDWFRNNIKLYPFMLPFESRLKILKADCENDLKTYDALYKNKTLYVTLSRENLITETARNNELWNSCSGTRWTFTFAGEMGDGEGPTKEFYTEFSKECQRRELDLWITESNDSDYVQAINGVFPSPCHRLSMSSKCILNAIGRVMAKSIIDDQMMSLNFSRTLYKSLCNYKTNSWDLGLTDLKDVMPSLTSFVGNLLNILKQKSIIEKNEFLSIEEKTEAVNKLTLQNSSFEDLCINFTIPGFPNVNMKDGGADIYLNIHNAQEYLQLLVTQILKVGPREKLEVLFKNGIDTFVPIDSFGMFYPADLEQIFNGEDTGAWTVTCLEKNCNLEERFTIQSTTVKYLFEVLSALDVVERKRFLMFVTSSRRLPVGGLQNLKPKLRILPYGSESDVDMYLPSAMTCFNTLLLPEFSSPQVLKEKLFRAILESGNSFQLV